MDTLLACRICLITDVKMFSLKIPQLNNAYFKLTGVMDASAPSYVCYECANILLKSEQFRLKCAQANRILTCIVLENSKITKDLIKSVDRKTHGLVSNVKYYPNEQYSIDCTDFDNTKDDIDIKLENNDKDIEIDGSVDDTDIEQNAYAENDMKTEEINETNVEYLDFDLLDSPEESIKNHKRKQTNESIKDVMLVEKLDQEKAMLEIIYRKYSENYKKSNYKCEFCFRGFVSISTYDNHMKKHTKNGREFECDFCHSMFETKSQIIKHFQTYHKYKYKCKICTYICFHLTHATNHALRHGGNEYLCELCGKVCRYSTNLLAHKKFKHQASWTCDLCGETFSNEHEVFSHKEKIHIQEINEKLGPECETCGVFFASEKAWKRHLIHSSNHQNILECKVCGDIVLNSEQLEEHLRISQNCKGILELPKEIYCKVCNQRFDTYNHCRSHMRREHLEFQYICEICGKVFLMSYEYEIFEFLEAENSQQKSVIKQRRKTTRCQNDPFALDDESFILRYRLRKDLVVNLCEELRCYMKHPTKSTDLSVEDKVLIALSFYATGSYQRPIGDIGAHSVAQQTVSAVISEITKCLNEPHFRAKYIHFPIHAAERRENVRRFYHKFGIPGVLGCIDCSHIAIVRPVLNEERYYCRKQYHSLNVQMICNAEMDIISVDASNGGATHDSFIWANHPLKTHMEELCNNEAIWLLGDSGYPLRRCMMTPVIDAVADSPEEYYTRIHVRTRNVIERTIGILKARFRCLLVHRVLHYDPHMAASIVNACVILHNICNRASVPVEELPNEDITQEAQLQPNRQRSDTHTLRTSQNSELQVGIAARSSLINRLWADRQI